MMRGRLDLLTFRDVELRKLIGHCPQMKLAYLFLLLVLYPLMKELSDFNRLTLLWRDNHPSEHSRQQRKPFLKWVFFGCAELCLGA